MRFSTVLSLVTVLLLTGTAHAAGSRVPEPGSLLLLATGAAGVAGYAWWTRRKK
jgi:hypothetical protein